MTESRSPEVIAEICRNLYTLRNSSLKISVAEFNRIKEERRDLAEFFDNAVTDGILEVTGV